MCGIAGIYNFGQRPVDRPLLQRMTELLAHRGPDDSGLFIEGAIGLGHRRLSILDLSPSGHQPMCGHSGRVWISYNGECYNHLEQRPVLAERGHQFHSTSDTETILALYEEFGLDFLSRIDGMFALAIWDSQRKRLIIARDRLGIKPLYFTVDGQRLAFASEMKALLADARLAMTLDPEGLGSYLELMSIPDPRTILSGVSRLEPGHYLLIEDGKVGQHRYWDVPVEGRRLATDFAAASQAFSELFQETVGRHLLADVPVGAFLSGGIDSSAVVAAMREHSAGPIHTFSSTFKGQTDFDESSQAAAIAGRFRTNHHEIELTPRLVEALPRIAWHADEPLAISSAFALYFLAEETSRKVRVVLTGDGGDEVFAGYPWRHLNYAAPPEWLPERLMKSVRRLSRLLLPDLAAEESPLGGRLRAWLDPGERYARSLRLFPSGELDSLLANDLRVEVHRHWKSNLVERYFNHLGAADQLTRKLYADLKTTLVSEMLTKVDRMTMAFGLEARVPFLDHRLVEWSFGLPSDFKMREGLGKAIVRKGLENQLPHDLLYAPKHGFNVPMKDWLTGPLRSFVRDNLAESVIARRGIFKPAAISRLIDQLEQGDQLTAHRILAVLMLELWFQQFVDRREALTAPQPTRIVQQMAERNDGEE